MEEDNERLNSLEQDVPFEPEQELLIPIDPSEKQTDADMEKSVGKSWFQQAITNRLVKIRMIQWIIFITFILIFVIVFASHPAYLSYDFFHTYTSDDTSSKSSSPSLPPCEKSVTFIFSGCCGFGSELVTLLNVIIFANDTNRPLFIQQGGWNYGVWNDFFEDFPTPNCVMPPNAKQSIIGHAIESERLAEVEQEFLKGDHLFINRYGFHVIDKYMMANYGRSKMDGSGVDWELSFKAEERALKWIWKPNPIIQELIDRQEELNRQEEGSGPVAGVHIRLGDKAREVESWNSHQNTLETYVQAISDFTNDPRSLWIMSDNHGIVPNVSEIATSWDVRRVLQITEENQQSHSQLEFNKLTLQERIKKGQHLVAEISLLVQVDYLVVTLSSNIGRLLCLLRGWDKKDSQKSLDLDFFPTSIPPDFVDTITPHTWAKPKPKPAP